MTGLLLIAVALLVWPRPGWSRRATAWVWRHRRREPAADASIAFALALAGELRAGSEPQRALRVCSERYRIGRSAARAAALGGDVAAALRDDARSERAPLLRTIAAAWELAGRTGAALADVLEHAADGHRRTEEVRRTLQVELASPKASARVMSALPLVGLGLALLIGANPLVWLTTSPIGLGCLAAGLAFNLAGVWWIHRIVRGQEHQAWA